MPKNEHLTQQQTKDTEISQACKGTNIRSYCSSFLPMLREIGAYVLRRIQGNRQSGNLPMNTYIGRGIPSSTSSFLKVSNHQSEPFLRKQDSTMINKVGFSVVMREDQFRGSIDEEAMHRIVIMARHIHMNMLIERFVSMARSFRITGSQPI